MAGFFKMFDYARPGKGVSKDEPKKSRFAYFFELFFRKFWKLIQLNLLYLLFCIPIITIGPATAGFTYVLRNMANERPVFLFSDFWDAFKLNWKQSLAWSLMAVIVGALVFVTAMFYFTNAGEYDWMYVPAALSLCMALMLTMMSFYAMLMIVTLELPITAIIKNAFILAVVCLKSNLLTLFFIAVILAAMVLLFPTSLILLLLIVPALIGFIVCYNAYPGIQKYAIDPFLEQEGKEPENPGDRVFRDEEPSAGRDD